MSGEAEVAAPAAVASGAHHHENSTDHLPQPQAPEAPDHLPPTSHHEHPERCAAAIGCVTAVAPVPLVLADVAVAVSPAVPDACAAAITAARPCPEPPPPRR